MNTTSDRSKRLLSLRLPAAPESARAARDAMKSLSRYLSQERLDDVRLMVDELATNSLRHGALAGPSKIGVTVDLDGDVLTVQVDDPGRGFRPHSVSSRAEGSGWGLFLVDQLANSWGLSSDGSTTVWFQILVRTPSEARTRW